MLLQAPVAQLSGQPLTGLVRTEFIADRPGVTSFPLSARITTRSHPAVSLDRRRAKLTRRRYPGSELALIAPERWAFAREETGVVASVELAHAILLEAALSFLGLGVQPPLFTWGLMIAEAKNQLFFRPWLIAIPGAALVALIFAINLVGDAVRDVTAPEGRA